MDTQCSRVLGAFSLTDSLFLSIPYVPLWLLCRPETLATVLRLFPLLVPKFSEQSPFFPCDPSLLSPTATPGCFACHGPFRPSFFVTLFISGCSCAFFLSLHRVTPMSTGFLQFVSWVDSSIRVAWFFADPARAGWIFSPAFCLDSSF